MITATFSSLSPALKRCPRPSLQAGLISICLLFLQIIPQAQTADAEQQPSTAEIEFFERKVRPALIQYCHECHSRDAKKLKAGLLLDSRAGFLKGGDSGPAFVPKDPEKSRVIEAVRFLNPDLQMPPKQKLPESVIADLTAWVAMGAPWPPEAASNSQTAALEDDSALRQRQQQQSHWAWQPLQNPGIPPVQAESWPKTPLDYFILSALETKGLSPAPPAARRVLLRRAYFDLIGLPPTPEQIDAFEQDRSPNAFEKVIEQLLASPHYGERWGRHWLDVARYGEDQAHSFQPRLYPQGFRYRDWLVQALNEDLPYNRFVLEQIAADLLPENKNPEKLAALGFFALGPVYYGDSKMFDQWDDRVDTLTRGFLGLTVACARCHDHKYDPVSTKDYYALAGIIASSEYREAPLVPEPVAAAYHQAQTAIQTRAQEIDAFLDAEARGLMETLPDQTAKYILAAWQLLNQRKTDPAAKPDPIAAADGLHPFIVEKWLRYLQKPQTEAALDLSKWAQLLAKQSPAANLTAGSAASAEAAETASAYQRYLLSLVALRKAIQENTAAAQALSAEKPPETAGPPPLTAALTKTQTTILDEIAGKDGVFGISRAQAEKLLSESQKARLTQLRVELDRLKKEAPEKYPFVHALQESAKPRNLPVLARGNPSSPGEEVPRGFLSFLSPEQNQIFTNGSGRLALAREIVSEQNPLSARVLVNRVWQHHFGRGLVRTPSNFGLLGERPTHPALLDFLARQLIASGWSLKTLHRQMMLSAAYQMSVQSNPAGHGLDPENKLLWRMNRRRLEVETWRDAMLAVAGNLNPALGGPSLDLAKEGNRRRTFYAKISRHELDSVLRLFDFPDPNVTSDLRPVTTVPLQQLFVLNSEFMVQQAKALAARVHALAPAPALEAERIQSAFRLAYGRAPAPREIELGLTFLQHEPIRDPNSKTNPLSPWEQYAQALLASNEFLYVD